MLGVYSTVDVHLIYSVGVCTSNLDEEVINVEKEDYNRNLNVQIYLAVQTRKITIISMCNYVQHIRSTLLQ
jgi:hypothetical protein